MCTTAQLCRFLSLQKQWSLRCGEGEYWETEANSSCHLPVGCLPHIQQDSKDVVDSAPAIILLHYNSAEELSTGNDLCSRGLLLPDPAVCFAYRAQVFSLDAKHCKCVRGIFLRGKRTQRMAEGTKEEFCV